MVLEGGWWELGTCWKAENTTVIGTQLRQCHKHDGHVNFQEFLSPARLPKQSNSYQSTWTCLCPTVQLTSQDV